MIIVELGLRNFIKSFDFEMHVFSKPVQQQAEAISDILISAQKQFIPIKTITIKTTDQMEVKMGFAENNLETR